MNELKFTVYINELASLLKVHPSTVSKFVIFDDSSMSHVTAMFKQSPPTGKQIDWCFTTARSHMKQRGLNPDWQLYEVVKKRLYNQSPAFKKTEEPSNGELRSQREKQQQEYKDNYKLQCEKRSLEYMQLPDSPKKAAAYGKYGFLSDMKPTDSHNLSYEEMSANYITLQMVKFAQKSVNIPQEDSTPPVLGSLFEDGQPVKPDYAALFDSLDDIDDSQFEPTVVILDDNISSNDPKIGTMLRQTGLF